MSTSGINIHCCEIKEPLGLLDLMQTSAKRRMHQRWCTISTFPPHAANPVLLNCTAPKRDMTRQVHYISLTRVFGQPCDVPLRLPPLLMVSPTSVLTELSVSDASEGCTVSVHHHVQQLEVGLFLRSGATESSAPLEQILKLV